MPGQTVILTGQPQRALAKRLVEDAPEMAVATAPAKKAAPSFCLDMGCSSRLIAWPVR